LESNLASFYQIKTIFDSVLGFYYTKEVGKIFKKSSNDFADEVDPDSWEAFFTNIKEDIRYLNEIEEFYKKFNYEMTVHDEPGSIFIKIKAHADNFLNVEPPKYNRIKIDIKIKEIQEFLKNENILSNEREQLNELILRLNEHQREFVLKENQDEISEKLENIKSKWKADVENSIKESLKLINGKNRDLKSFYSEKTYNLKEEINSNLIKLSISENYIAEENNYCEYKNNISEKIASVKKKFTEDVKTISEFNTQQEFIAYLIRISQYVKIFEEQANEIYVPIKIVYYTKPEHIKLFLMNLDQKIDSTRKLILDKLKNVLLNEREYSEYTPTTIYKDSLKIIDIFLRSSEHSKFRIFQDLRKAFSVLKELPERIYQILEHQRIFEEPRVYLNFVDNQCDVINNILNIFIKKIKSEFGTKEKRRSKTLFGRLKM
jgi:hypothetical protein